MSEQVSQVDNVIRNGQGSAVKMPDQNAQQPNQYANGQQPIQSAGVQYPIQTGTPYANHYTSAEGEPEQFRKLFVGGLSANTTVENLREFYGKFGTVVDCIVVYDPATKISRNFGFVTFATKQDVDNAMKNRPHEIDGKTVDAKRSVPRDQTTPGKPSLSTQRLFIAGITEAHTEDHFKEYFSKFGNVKKVEIIMDRTTNQPKGFGFVVFDDFDSVDQCVLIKSHVINNLRCNVKKGFSRDELARQQQGRDSMGYGARGGFQGGRGNYLGGTPNRGGFVGTPRGGFESGTPRGGFVNGSTPRGGFSNGTPRGFSNGTPRGFSNGTPYGAQAGGPPGMFNGQSPYVDPSLGQGAPAPAWQWQQGNSGFFGGM